MHTQTPRLRAFALAAFFAVLTCSGWASADPPSRVARLGYMTGAVSLSFAGESDWVQASVNRPLTTGDRIWVDAGARAEIQVGGTMLRVNGPSGVSVLNLDDRVAQVQLTEGTMNVRVRRLGPGQVFEVDTPNLAFTLRQPGEFRISVDAEGNATDIVVRKGQGEVYGEGAAYVVDSRQPYRFAGTGLREYQYVEVPRFDDFDRWASDRDRRYDTSVSARYVSPDVIGYQDLDANGTWRVDATYGNVWVPNRVAAGWAPYSDGHWAWVDPWGWTWVDDAPWGFAVSHYGRWTNMRGTWGWVPGPVRTQAYYAPALVAFVGGDNFQLTISSGSVGGVAWFPLGPREIYRPSYDVSRAYFENVNRSNTVVSNTTINNYYTNTNVTNVTYVNRQVPGAVVAVPTTTFVQSQPVARAAVRIPRDTLSRAQVAFVAPVAPTEKSVRGAAAQGDKPPARVFERPVVARTQPAAPRAGFAAQQQQLTSKPGKPLDDSARKELKAAPTAPAPVVKVVEPAQKAPPTLRPPAVAAAKPGDARGKDEPRGKEAPRGKDEQRAQPVAPVAAPQPATPVAAAPPRAAPPAPASQPMPTGKAGQRDKADKPDKEAKADPRAQPVPPPAAPQPAAPVAAAPASAAPPAPVAPPPAPSGKAGQRDKADKPDKEAKADARAQPVPPPAAPQPAAPVAAAPPSAAPPAPATPPAPSGKAAQRDKADKPDQRAQPSMAPPPQAKRAAEPSAVPRDAERPPPATAARQPEPRPPATSAPPPPPQPATMAQPRAREAKPAVDKSKDKEKSDEDKKRDEDANRPKG